MLKNHLDHLKSPNPEVRLALQLNSRCIASLRSTVFRLPASPQNIENSLPPLIKPKPLLQNTKQMLLTTGQTAPHTTALATIKLVLDHTRLICFYKQGIWEIVLPKLNIRIQIKHTIPPLYSNSIIEVRIRKGRCKCGGFSLAFSVSPTMPITVPLFNDLNTKVFISSKCA